MSTKSVNSKAKISGMMIGVITGIDQGGNPLVAYPGNISELPLMAKTTVVIDSDAIGREAALLFEWGEVGKPVIVGLIHNQELLQIPAAGNASLGKSEALDTSKQFSSKIEKRDTPQQFWSPDQDENELIANGESVVLRANEELVLKCGKSSITLTKAGKVTIRGEYISTRSTGANRIKGGSVQIN